MAVATQSVSEICQAAAAAARVLAQVDTARKDAALHAICARHPGKVRVSFVGADVPPGWAGHPAAACEPELHDYDAHARRLPERRWDIALLPLADHDYNAATSTIQWQEYAAAGIPSIVSDRPAYRFALHDGCDGLLVPDAPQACVDALDRLIANPALATMALSLRTADRFLAA